MSILLKSMWRNMLRGNPLGRSLTPRSLCSSLSEVTRIKSPDPVMSSLKGAARADDVLRTVEHHLPQMTQAHMLQALRSLFELHRDGELDGGTDSLIKDPTFGLLCKNFKKYARELEVNEAIEATKVLSYLKVPVDSLLVQTLLQMIRCNINQLNIRHIMFLDFVLGRFDKKNHLVDALKLALPLAFQIHLPLELDREDLPLLRDMLAYACSKDLPDRVINNIVTGLLLHDQAIDAQTARSIIWSLCQINCTESKYPTRVQLLHICSDILSLRLDDLSYDEVLKTAAKLKGRILEKHPEYYHEQLMDAIAEYVIRNGIEFEKGLLISRVLSRIAHTHLGLVEHLCNQAASNPETLSNARINILFGFINCLSNNNFTPTADKWKELKRQISKNPILDGKNFALPWAKLCLEMASLGHYEDKLLARVFSQEFLEEYLARDNNILDHLQLMTLHEAVKSFHSESYALPQEVLNNAMDLYPINRFNEQIEICLAKGLGGKDYVTRNVILPCGITADLLTCVKSGYPVVITTAPDRGEKVRLADLKLPPSSVIISIINFNAGCFSMNSNRLRGTFKLILDIIEKQGFVAVPINVNEWLNMPDHEKTPYLLREIGYKCGEMGMKLIANT